MNRKLIMQVVLAVALAVAIGTAGPARATYPGATNGRLAFGATVDGNTDLYSVLPDGQALHRLTDDPGFDACPAYSADGGWIAWCSGQGLPPGPVVLTDIWVMKQNGTDKRRLTDLGGAAAFPDFSPVGSQIVFQYKAPGPTTQQLWLVNTDGTDAHVLVSSSTSNNRLPAFSPDGSKIAFISDRTGLPQVWLMNADGSNQVQLTFDLVPKDQLPDWSPDGSQIAFVERTAATGGDIWVMNADGSDPHALTSAADNLGTAWSPDGTQIATLNWTTRTVEVMNTDGTNIHPVQPLGIQFVPGWQPRGTGLEDDSSD
jgi:Tol biopolymer transport system component